MNGKRAFTPMFLVVLTLGTTNFLFALGSIPAIYGLTRDTYLVFTTTVLALMGLRQLIGVLLQRLSFINGGEHVEWAPNIPTVLSLVIITGTLVNTVVVSLVVSSRMGAAEDAADTGAPRLGPRLVLDGRGSVIVIAGRVGVLSSHCAVATLTGTERSIRHRRLPLGTSTRPRSPTNQRGAPPPPGGKSAPPGPPLEKSPTPPPGKAG